MLAKVTRSGVTESTHHGVIAVVDVEGRLRATHGDVEARYHARSSVKPFQAFASVSAGAMLPAEWLALACASHTGAPIHIASVRAMLATVGLTEAALATPPTWPEGPHRDRLVGAEGARPLPVYHNCSGKHAGFLTACIAAGWSVSGYHLASHPLQGLVREVMEDVTSEPIGEMGIDGCGAPTYTVSTESLARAFNRLGNDVAFDGVFSSMHQFPRMVSGVGMSDAEFAIHTFGVAKRGAEGNLGLAVRGRGAIAIKVFDGSSRAIGPVITDVLGQLGWITPSMAEMLEDATRVPMSGGGTEVGTVESVAQLTRV